ncbi:MAG: NUDIX pyrophosphatase [Ignavibacterium sp.]|nr:NUDIX pyrophosphatase [Ignavibacterium sp.]MCX7610928.1 NUDIX pyrophosphatase [Ignavibacterium sp.]MDW8376342.1 NUDIX pyrophosphatase [Ignavibacteriales bacterium]
MKVATNYIEAHIIRKSNDQIEFLLLKRASHQWFPNLWQMVSGKIKDGEKAYESALREIQEETGLVPEKLWVVPNINSFYLFEDDVIHQVPVFLGLVDYNSLVKISSEHSEFKWVLADEAKKLLSWPGQRKSVEIIQECFDSTVKSFLHLSEIKIK